jgi:hypothetical protein
MLNRVAMSLQIPLDQRINNCTSTAAASGRAVVVLSSHENGEPSIARTARLAIPHSLATNRILAPYANPINLSHGFGIRSLRQMHGRGPTAAYNWLAA